jgi:hypothetical protein
MLLHHIRGGIRCLAASSHTFRRYRDIEHELYEKLFGVLIYEAESTKSAVNSSVAIANRREICRELCGLSFTPGSEFASTLKESSQDLKALISINNKALFGLKQRGNCRVFLLPAEVIDIKKRISGKLTRDDCLIRITPVGMFLRYVAPESFSNDANRYACLIIDDPLLRETYGFIDYYKLLKLMDKYNFFTTIGFIPRNYNRTDRSIADLFKKRPDRFSICVHGCDHTQGEFGKRDSDYLNKKIRLATARMIEHEKRTGIPFDRVMVYPQGVFSIEAMEVLDQNNYLAAVNSVAVPVNGSDYLDPSEYLRCNIMKYGKFPLFMRKLPESLIDFAFDLFWGKPAFMVIHSDYLRNGYEKLINCIIKFNSLSENIKWESVGNIINKFVIRRQEDKYCDLNIDLSGFSVNGFKENAKIRIRSCASEFRDNYLCKNEALLNLAIKLKNLILPVNQ